MYLTYGWPPVIPLEQSLCSSSQHIIYLKVINRLLLLVYSSHIELWSSSQHKVRFCQVQKRFGFTVERSRVYPSCMEPRCQVNSRSYIFFFLHLFKVQFTEKKERVQIGGKRPSELFLANIFSLLNEQVPFVKKDLPVSNIVSDSKHMLHGLSDGSLYSISWKGEFYGPFELDTFPYDGSEVFPSPHSLENGSAVKGLPRDLVPNNNNVSKSSAIVQLELSLLMRLLFVLYSDGRLFPCSVSKTGLKQAESIKAEK